MLCGGDVRMTTTASEQNSPNLGKAALLVSSAAVACGACCVLPFALPAVVVAFAGSTLASFANAHALLTTIAVLIVAGAWVWTGYQRWKTKKRLHRSTKIMMSAATAILGVAMIWPQLEPFVIELIANK